MNLEYDVCKTPKNENGSCRPPKECPVLLEMIRVKHISAENRTFLQKSLCGVQPDGKPLLCCKISDYTNDLANGKKHFDFFYLVENIF
jgi:hypothetical protein